MYFPALITLDKKSNMYVVSFRDIPEAQTIGNTFEEAKNMALDCLITAMDFYFEDMRLVPNPSEPEEDEIVIKLPMSIWAKVGLLNALVESQTTQSELARLMGKPRQYVHRLIDLEHNTKIDNIENALYTLGKKGNLYWV